MVTSTQIMIAFCGGLIGGTYSLFHSYSSIIQMTDFGLQQHGKKLTVDVVQPNITACLIEMRKLQIEANAYLECIMLSALTYNKFTIPCQKCLKDAALQFIDLGNAMNELVDLCEGK